MPGPLLEQGEQTTLVARPPRRGQNNQNKDKKGWVNSFLILLQTQTITNKVRVSNPNIRHYNPYPRPAPGGRRSALGNRSVAAQEERAPDAFERRLRAALPFIPTYVAPMSLAELKLRANTDKEMQRAIPLWRDLIADGRVISASTRIVDPVTGKTLFLYLGERYGDDRTQYTNHEGLGDARRPFTQPVSVGFKLSTSAHFSLRWISVWQQGESICMKELRAQGTRVTKLYTTGSMCVIFSYLFIFSFIV